MGSAQVCAVTSRSHFSSRPQFQSASPEMVSSFRYQKNIAEKSSWGGSFQTVLFGGASTDSDDLAEYLMPFGSSSATVSEDLVVDASKTLHAQHFNILSNNFFNSSAMYMRDKTAGNAFKSSIRMRPQEWSVGLGFRYHQILFNRRSNNPWWMSISSPLVHVERDVRLQETVENDGGGLAQVVGPGGAPQFSTPSDGSVAAGIIQGLQSSMQGALVQPAWLYGKISSKELSKTGFADVEIKIGNVVYQSPLVMLDVYAGMLFPTGNKDKNHYLFAPQIGNGRHLGIMGGGTFEWVIKSPENCSWGFKYESAMNLQYLFANTQKRSFDLNGKPWSRYAEVYKDKGQAKLAADVLMMMMMVPSMDEAMFDAYLLATPGINIFTQDLHVSPGLNFTWNNGFVATHKSWSFEAGYNLHARESESVHLKDVWTEGAALKFPEGMGFTNPARDITASSVLNQKPPLPTTIKMFDNYNDSIIKQSDLNLRSAAHPSYVSHTFYGACGYRCEDSRLPIGCALGSSYEFPGGNKALSRWSVWAKTDISF
jgi:hypothetical protein